MFPRNHRVPDIQRASSKRPGRVTPPQAVGLRAGAVRLGAGRVMDWHSTREREELLVMLEGRVRLELDPSRRVSRVPLRAGECAWLPPQTMHRVVNRSMTAARYVYVTARP